MARFKCLCGTTLSTSGEIPNPIEWKLWSDVTFTAHWEATDGVARMSDLEHDSVLLYRCPVSDHLWVFWDGIEAAPRVYAPDSLPPGWTS